MEESPFFYSVHFLCARASRPRCVGPLPASAATSVIVVGRFYCFISSARFPDSLAFAAVFASCASYHSIIGNTECLLMGAGASARAFACAFIRPNSHRVQSENRTAYSTNPHAHPSSVKIVQDKQGFGPAKRGQMRDNRARICELQGRTKCGKRGKQKRTLLGSCAKRIKNFGIIEILEREKIARNSIKC